MGDHTELVEDGVLCVVCGGVNEDGPERPRACRSCLHELGRSEVAQFIANFKKHRRLRTHDGA